jgi:molybdopterin-containing oxidoreductase family membrane subunit
MNKNAFRILLGLGVIGLIAGSIGMWARLQYGHIPMAYGSYVPWGLWVAFDLIFLGLTAGAWIIVLLTYGFGRKQFERLGPVAVLTLLVSLLCEGIIISLDLGQPMRVYRFLVTPSFTSMLTWLVVCITAMWIIYLPMFYFLLRGKFAKADADADKEKYRPIVRILALINIPVGFAFFAVQGAFFAVMINRPTWSSALTPVLFMASAFLSGGALVTAMASIFDRDKSVVVPLARIVLAMLAVFLLLEAVQFFIGYQSNSPGTVAALNMIAFGPNWWVFWIIHLLIGSLIPLLLLLFRPGDSGSVAWACLLIVITFLAVRYNAVVPDLAAYNLEGLDKFFVHKRLSQAYIPNLYEWLVSLWVVSLWVVIFLLGTKWLPVIPAEKGGEQHVA